MWKQINKDLNNRGQFMKDWEQTEAVCRRLLELRMSLVPYLYSACAEYRDTGRPPVRALVMDYPEDATAWSVDDEYLFGASLLVAPLFTGQAKRSLYLPEGDWYDFWTHEKHVGGRAIEVAKPADQIPVFVKGETLLPLAASVECITPTTEFALTVHAFGAKPAPFVLYEDDGVTFDFEQGKLNRIELRWDGATGQVAKTGNYAGPSRYKMVQWTSAGK